MRVDESRPLLLDLSYLLSNFSGVGRPSCIYGVDTRREVSGSRAVVSRVDGVRTESDCSGVDDADRDGDYLEESLHSVIYTLIYPRCR